MPPPVGGEVQGDDTTEKRREEEKGGGSDFKKGIRPKSEQATHAKRPLTQCIVQTIHHLRASAIVLINESFIVLKKGKEWFWRFLAAQPWLVKS